MSNIEDFVISGNTLVKYIGHEKTVVVPDGIRSIEREAFKSKEIENISLPESLTAIENLAFYHCSKLLELIIPDNVKRIGGKAFEGCSELRKLILPRQLEYIPYGMCSGCVNLESITIPEGVKSIEQLSFSTCYKLKNIDLPTSLVNIDDHAFAWNGDLEEIIIPENTKKLGQYVFMDCKSLKNVHLPSGLEEVVWEPFVECICSFSVKKWSPTITKAVKNAKITAIYTDDISLVPAKYKLEAAVGFVLQDTKDFESEQGKAYISYISKNTVKLCPLAFSNPKVLYFLCENKLIKPKDIQLYIEEAENSKDAEIKAMILEYQNSLGMTDILRERERREKVQESISEERAEARAGKDGIEGLTFVISGELSFIWKARSNVKEYLEKKGAKLGSSVTKKTDYLVCSDPDSNSDKVLKARELGVEILNEEDFNQLIGRRFKNEENIVIPDWITSLSYEIMTPYQYKDHALKGCNKAKSIKLSKRLKLIDYQDFELLENLKTITIPSSVKGIKQIAFSSCNALESIIIEEGVEYIEDNAFFMCKNLEKIVIPRSVTSMGDVIYDCPKAIIHVAADSYAEEWAKEKGLPSITA